MTEHKEVGEMKGKIKYVLQTIDYSNMTTGEIAEKIIDFLSKTSGVGEIVEDLKELCQLNHDCIGSVKVQERLQELRDKYLSALSPPNKSNEEIVEEFEKEFPITEFERGFPRDQRTDMIVWLRTQLTQREIKLPEKKEIQELDRKFKNELSLIQCLLEISKVPNHRGGEFCGTNKCPKCNWDVYAKEYLELDVGMFWLKDYL